MSTGYSVQAYVEDAIRRGARVKHEPMPWLHPRDSRGHSNNAYRLLIFPGGFMQRIYDWQR